MTRALDAIADAESAEEIFDRLGVPYDAHRLRVNRLHVLSRFRAYVAREAEEPDRARLRRLLAQAHADFAASTPQRERVFAVFRQQADADGCTFVPLDTLTEPEQGSEP